VETSNLTRLKYIVLPETQSGRIEKLIFHFNQRLCEVSVEMWPAGTGGYHSVTNVGVSWDIAPFNPYVNRRFLVSCSADFLP
jgi:hypothetical protein